MKINKTKNKLSFFVITFFLIIFCFAFGKTNTASADIADWFIWAGENECEFTVQVDVVGNPSFKYKKGEHVVINNTTAKTCQIYCNIAGIKDPADCLFDGGVFDYEKPINLAVNEEEQALLDKKNSICKLDILNISIESLINCILLYILDFLGKILQMVGTLFNWTNSSSNLSLIIGNSVVYKAWALVRDLLNVSFILFLLFSAFATVFQVEKYNYKKTLLTLILMALLVNFSYPITLFIIDFSNVLMFYLIDFFRIDNSIIAQSANGSLLGNIIHPPGDPGVAHLLIAIIFLFIFIITFLVVTIMLLIRGAVLAILVIFSSLAFIGEAIPPLSSYASDWWKKLFSYAFFGPIMIFMILISTQMMNVISSIGQKSMKKFANINSYEPTLIASLAFFLIPIIILWIGLGTAREMGIAGANAVTGKAEKFLKEKGKKFSFYNYSQKQYAGYKKKREERKEEKRWKIGESLGRRANNLSDTIEGIYSPKAKERKKARIDAENDKKIKKANEKMDVKNMSATELRNIADNSKNKYEKMAALQQLADLDSATGTDLNNMRTEFGETSQAFKQLANKVKTYDPVAAFSDKTGMVDETKLIDHMKSNKFDAKKLSASSLANDRFLELAFENDVLSNKDLEELRKKSTDHKESLLGARGRSGSLDRIVARATNSENDTDKNIQMAYFSQTGNIQNSAFNDHVFSSMDQDTARRMTSSTIRTHAADISRNINSGKYKSIIQNMMDNSAREELNNYMGFNDFARGSNGDNIQRVIHNDPFLNNI